MCNEATQRVTYASSTHLKFKKPMHSEARRLTEGLSSVTFGEGGAPVAHSLVGHWDRTGSACSVYCPLLARCDALGGDAPRAQPLKCTRVRTGSISASDKG